MFKSMSTRAPSSRATCHLTDFSETLPGEDWPSPPVFPGFHQGNCFKIGKMCEALAALVLN